MNIEKRGYLLLKLIYKSSEERTNSDVSCGEYINSIAGGVKENLEEALRYLEDKQWITILDIDNFRVTITTSGRTYVEGHGRFWSFLKNRINPLYPIITLGLTIIGLFLSKEIRKETKIDQQINTSSSTVTVVTQTKEIKLVQPVNISSSTVMGITQTGDIVSGNKTVNYAEGKKTEKIVKDKISGLIEECSRKLDILKNKKEKELAIAIERSLDRVGRSGLVRQDSEDKLKVIYQEVDDLIYALNKEIKNCLYEIDEVDINNLKDFKPESIKLEEVEKKANAVKEFLQNNSEEALKRILGEK